MRYTLRFAGLLVLLPLISYAEDEGSYKCSFGDNLRRVEIVYTEPGAAVPCEVRYFKDTEAPGQTQVLWAARTEMGYCEYKAGEFVSKLRGWGWSCEADGPAPPDEPAADVTEMLGDESVEPEAAAEAVAEDDVEGEY